MRHTDTERLARICGTIIGLARETNQDRAALSAKTLDGLKRLAQAALDASQAELSGERTLLDSARDALRHAGPVTHELVAARIDAALAGRAAALPRCHCGKYEFGPDTLRITEASGRLHYRAVCDSMRTANPHGCICRYTHRSDQMCPYLTEAESIAKARATGEAERAVDDLLKHLYGGP